MKSAVFTFTVLLVIFAEVQSCGIFRLGGRLITTCIGVTCPIGMACGVLPPSGRLQCNATGRFSLNMTNPGSLLASTLSLTQACALGGINAQPTSGCYCPIIRSRRSNFYDCRQLYSLFSSQFSWAPIQVFNPTTGSCTPVSQCPNGTVDFYTAPSSVALPIPLVNPFGRSGHSGYSGRHHGGSRRHRH